MTQQDGIDEVWQILATPHLDAGGALVYERAAMREVMRILKYLGAKPKGKQNENKDRV